MKADLQRKREVRTKFDVITILLGTTSAALLILGFYSRYLTHPNSNKWAAAIILGLLGVFWSFLFLGKIRALAYAFSIFALSIRLDVFLYRKETSYIQLHGLPLSLFTILLVFLWLEWIIRIMKRQSTIKFYPELSIPVLIAILLAGASIAVSTDMALSLSALGLFICCYMTFLYFANNLDEKAITTILLMMMISILLQSFIGVLQYATGSTLGLDMFGESEKSFRLQATGIYTLSRVGGTIGSPNGLAMFLNLYIPALMCSLFMKIKRRYKLLALVTIFAGLLVELLTLSRGGWLALAASVYVAGLFILRHFFKSYLKAIVITTVVICIVCVSVIALSTNVQERLFQDNYKAPKERLYMLEIAASVIQANPVLGVGINAYTTVMNRYDHTPVSMSYEFPYPVHNAFFLFAAECGLLAFAALMIFLFNLFRKVIILARYDDKFLSLAGIGFFLRRVELADPEPIRAVPDHDQFHIVVQFRDGSRDGGQAQGKI